MPLWGMAHTGSLRTRDKDSILINGNFEIHLSSNRFPTGPSFIDILFFKLILRRVIDNIY